MLSTSRRVTSNQTDIHPKLEAVVKRHLATTFQRPFPDYSLRIFDKIEQRRRQHNGPLIIDSFCGVGESTVHLARQHPDALVLGIDKSDYRINKHRYCHSAVNYCLIRADVDDFWRLAVLAKWRPIKHYLLYPNPWPKSIHLKRRCHGSPLFASLLALGGQIELRSNWSLYVKEFCAALNIAGIEAKTDKYEAVKPITPFERKYQQANQDLWRCICEVE